MSASGAPHHRQVGPAADHDAADVVVVDDGAGVGRPGDPDHQQLRQLVAGRHRREQRVTAGGRSRLGGGQRPIRRGVDGRVTAAGFSVVGEQASSRPVSAASAPSRRGECHGAMLSWRRGTSMRLTRRMLRWPHGPVSGARCGQHRCRPVAGRGRHLRCDADGAAGHQAAAAGRRSGVIGAQQGRVRRPDLAERSGPIGSLSRRWLWLVAAASLILTFAQSPGQISPDTKLDLTANPLRFLARAFNLWNSELPFGQAQNQAYGYLFPHGAFFLVGDVLGLPGWVTQRLWWALLLTVGFWGLLRVAEALGIGSPTRGSSPPPPSRCRRGC